MSKDVEIKGVLKNVGKKDYLKKKNLLRRILRLEAQIGTLLSKVEKLEDTQQSNTSSSKVISQDSTNVQIITCDHT